MWPIRSQFFSILRLLGFGIISWIAIHVMAFFGIFVSLAYPLLWVLFPTQIPSLLYRDKYPHPESLWKAILNGILLLFFSIASIGLVYLENKLLFNIGFPQSQQTAFFTIPPKAQYKVNERIPMELKVTGISTAINAIQADVAFDPEMLEVVDIDISQSFATIFVQREIDNNAGYFRLNGGLPNPGYAESSGLFATAYFKAKKTGVTKVEFLPTSMILANDGYGSNIMKAFSSVSYFILPSDTPEGDSVPTLGTSVLGTSTQDVGEKLIFYDQSEDILGTQTTEREPQELTLIQKALQLLQRVNQAILSLWSRVFSRLTFTE